MKYAFIQHNPKLPKLYTFKIDDDLARHVNIGSKVFCETANGIAPGFVREITDDNNPIFLSEHLIPKRSVISTRTAFPLSNIRIPPIFLASIPSECKVERRVKEFLTLGRFNTKVKFTATGYLQDGYTAYLAAKKLGHLSLTGLCVPDKKKECTNG